MENPDGPDSMSTIGIAYVDGKMEAELKKNSAQVKRKYSVTPGLFQTLYHHLVSYYQGTQIYTHCELVFPQERSNSGTYLAYGVFSDEGVFVRERTFTNPAYKVLYLSLPRKNVSAALAFCKSQVGKGFDEIGMRYSAVWPLRTSPKKRGWWCTAFTATALQRAGVLREYQPNSLDTDDIVGLLSLHTGKVTGTLGLVGSTESDKKFINKMFYSDRPWIV
jgi:hypothetical protein